VTLARIERVERFLRSARALCDAAHPLYDAARAQLPAVTGLSAQNVAWALDNALELRETDWDLERLCERTPECARAHVLLSANVFVAALRAIAIAVAAAPEVHVRPSRREPLMVELLAQSAPGQFCIEEELRPIPGDHVWAYGSDETLARLKQALPADIVLHGHGNGYGVVVVWDDEVRSDRALERLAYDVVTDLVPFDQRGCLSPRVVLVQQEPSAARGLWRLLATAMIERGRQIPAGMLSHEERSDIVRYRDTLCVAGAVLSAGSGLVSLEIEELPWILPPTGRVLHVRPTMNAIEDLAPHATMITTIGVASRTSERAIAIEHAFPSARVAEIGRMQCPKLDGPVDLRGLFSPT
jgi:hypothetical protein